MIAACVCREFYDVTEPITDCWACGHWAPSHTFMNKHSCMMTGCRCPEYQSVKPLPIYQLDNVLRRAELQKGEKVDLVIVLTQSDDDDLDKLPGDLYSRAALVLRYDGDRRLMAVAPTRGEYVTPSRLRDSLLHLRSRLRPDE